MNILSKSINRKKILSTIVYVLSVFFLVFLITSYVGQRTVVDGESMESTLKNGDSLILNKISYRFSKPKRYDIVVFPGKITEKNQQEFYIKRIIGLPGETVEIKNGSVYIDNKELKSDIYAKDGITEEGSPEFNNITLKENEYY